MLAQAALLDGKFPQMSPVEWGERRGAGFAAFLRVDEMPITLDAPVTTPDVVVVLDAGLLRAAPLTSGLKPGGLLLANTDRPPGELHVNPLARVATVDANRIARASGLAHLDGPAVPAAVLGALCRLTHVVSLDSLLRAFGRRHAGRAADLARAVRAGWSRVRAEAELLV